MKITLTLSHDFESVADAVAFANKLEPLTAELNTAPAALAAAPEAPAIAAPAPPIDRENAETVNPSLKDRIDEIEETAKRKRRTKAEMEAARAEEAAKAAAPAPVAAKPAEPAPDDFDIDFTAPAAPAPAKISDADFRIAFAHFSKVVTDWREVLPKLLADLGAERMSALPEAKRPDAIARMNAHLKANGLAALQVAA